MANVATLGARAAFDVSAFNSGTAQMLQGLAKIRGAIKDSSSTLGTMNTKVDESSKKVGGLRSHFYAGAAGGLAFAASMKAINTVTGLVSSGFNKLTSGLSWGAELAIQAEQSETAFEVMLGSAKAAKQMMQDINAFALSTPFDVQGVTDNVTLLKGMNVATEDLLPTMKTLGDMSLGNKDKFGGLALAYGQVMAKGKLMSQEFNQLAERGINLRESLAKELKIEVSEVAKAMEDGKISANVFRNALVELANTQFGGMMEKQSKTLKGTLDKLQEQFGSMFRGAMESVFTSGTFKEFMDLLKPENLGGASSVIASVLGSILHEVTSIARTIGIFASQDDTERMRERGIVQAGGEHRNGMRPEGLFPTYQSLNLSGITLQEQQARREEIKAIKEKYDDSLFGRIFSQWEVDSFIEQTKDPREVNKLLKNKQLQGLTRSDVSANFFQDPMGVTKALFEQAKQYGEDVRSKTIQGRAEKFAGAGVDGFFKLFGIDPNRPKENSPFQKILQSFAGGALDVARGQIGNATFLGQQGLGRLGYETNVWSNDIAKRERPDLTRSTAGLQVGSSEAFSQLIKQMTGGGAQKIEEKQLEAMKDTAKGVAKLVDKLTTEGMTLLGIVDSL